MDEYHRNAKNNSENQYGTQPYAQNQYDPQQYAQNQYDTQQYAQNQYDTQQYAQNQYDTQQYAQNQYDTQQYAQNQYDPQQYAQTPENQQEIPLSVTDNPQKKHIYYNESALTPPKAKGQGLIIGTFILLVAMLLVGIIGLAWNIDKQMKENGNRDIEEFWKYDIFSDEDYDTEDESYTENDISENTERKILYHDYETEISVGVPEGYTFLRDSSFYGTENVSGVIYSMTDENGNILNVTAEYKLSADSKAEYDTVKNRAVKVENSNVSVSGELETGKILNYELPNNIKESCAVIDSRFPKDAVILITCSCDGNISLQDLQEAVLAVYYTKSAEFDPPMN